MNPFIAFSTRARNRTESAAMNGGMEIALTVGLFVLVGMGLDNWLGTSPAFVIVLFLFAAIGSGLRYYYTYTADMERLEAEMAEKRQGRRDNLNAQRQAQREQRQSPAARPADRDDSLDDSGVAA